MKEFNENHPIHKHLNSDEIKALKIIDKIYSQDLKGPQFATGNTLHFWGQFTDQLPEKFQPNGPSGHQYIKCSSKQEAEDLCRELRSFVFEKWPDSVEWASDGWYRWMIHDMKQMTLKFQDR